jgi:MFS family permease
MADVHQPAKSFIGKFTVLRGASRELWITFALKLMNYAAYKVTTLTLVLWLSAEYHYTDQDAAHVVLGWSVSMTVCTLLVGAVTDAIGLRRAFFLGTWVCIFARAVMVFAHTPWIAICLGLFPLALGEALGTPVLVAAVQKYSTTAQRSIAFSVAYMLLNAGAVMAGYFIDWVRNGLGEHGHLNLPWLHLSITTYRTLFLVSFGIEVLMLPVVWGIRDGVEVTDEGIRIVPPPPKSTGANFLVSLWKSVGNSARTTGRLFGELTRQEGFHRLVIFLLLVAFLKLIFMQMDYVFPKFCLRELGDGAPFGRLSNINSWLILPLVPIIGALTQRYPAYRMVVIGGIISAVSVFIMALPAAWFQGAANTPLVAWFGHAYLGLTGAMNPYYVLIFIFVIMMSFGEAFYSPRVYEYASAIAPKGQEASYGALSYLPFLLAKSLIGIFSGTLLANYCPATGPRHSGTMWLFVALTATIAPLGLILLRNKIRVHEAGRAD